MILTSVQNPRVKHVIALRERKQRKRDGLMVVDGFDELSLALDCSITPTEVFVCPELFHQQNNSGLTRRLLAAGVEVLEAAQPVFEKMAYRENPDGWLAVTPIPRRNLDDIPLGPAPLIVIAEALEKPGNLGALLRSADAAGASAVIVCDPTIDLGNPNVIRSSRGTVFSMKIAEATTADVLAWTQANNIHVVAATPEATTLYTDLNLKQATAIAVGTERQGLSAVWRDGTVTGARIPMLGRVNSLNVAQAATLFLFEAVRQRSLES
jgi:RNA methyltransferase, TrmH family